MSILVSLTTSESKRLIGKGLAQHPKVRAAFEKGRIVVSGGTTTSYFVQELLGEQFDPAHFACGIIAQGMICLSPEDRIRTMLIENGKLIPNDRSIPNYDEISMQIDRLRPGDVYVKGANAIDNDGNAGFLLAHPKGGNVLLALHQVYAMGIPFLIPVGLEKLIPSVIEAQRNMKGIADYDYTFGQACGYATVPNGEIFHELAALKLLTGISGTHVSSGGYGGSEGAVTLVLDGTEEQVEAAVALLKEIKGEAPIKAWKRSCKDCPARCSYMAERLEK